MLAAVTRCGRAGRGGGETQALIYNPKTKRSSRFNALGVAPTVATAESITPRACGFPPEIRPAVRDHSRHARRPHGHAASYGKLSLRESAWSRPSTWADGYPIEERRRNSIERNKGWLKQWALLSAPSCCQHAGEARGSAQAGENLSAARACRRAPQVGRAEQDARCGRGKNRHDAIMAPTIGSKRATLRRSSWRLQEEAVQRLQAFSRRPCRPLWKL